MAIQLARGPLSDTSRSVRLVATEMMFARLCPDHRGIADMHAFELEIDGCVYQGVWGAGDYDRLTIESHFGTTYAYLDGREPDALARSLLSELVRRSTRLAG